MIRSLKGYVTSVTDGSLVLLVHDVGFLVHTPTNRHLPQLFGEIELYTYLAVRENALDLYGFLSQDELAFFELLLTIPKIGPKSALSILTQADPKLLNDSIKSKDSDQLHKLSGLGKKTAENIVTNLQNKLDQLPDLGDQNLPLSNLSNDEKDAIDALITLGYDPKDAREYVSRQEKGLEAKALIQAVLKQLPTK